MSMKHPVIKNKVEEYDIEYKKTLVDSGWDLKDGGAETIKLSKGKTPDAKYVAYDAKLGANNSKM